MMDELSVTGRQPTIRSVVKSLTEQLWKNLHIGGPTNIFL